MEPSENLFFQLLIMTPVNEYGRVGMVFAIFVYIGFQLLIFTTLMPSLACRTIRLSPRIAKSGCLRFICYAMTIFLSVLWPIGVPVRWFLVSATKRRDICRQIRDEEQALAVTANIDDPPSYYEVVRLPTYPAAARLPTYREAVRLGRLPTYLEAVGLIRLSGCPEMPLINRVP